MSDVKWIKITTDIFDDEKMYAIETMPDGQLMELIWFKLLCLAGKCNNHGFLMINSKIAYTDEMLSKVFRVDVGSVTRALTLFQQLDMIEVVDNAYMIANWEKHQSGSSLEKIKEQNRERQRRFRDKQKVLALESDDSNVTVTSQSNVNCSYSLSISNNKDNKSNNNIYIKEIIDYLNNICDTHYRVANKQTHKLINARFNDGYTVDDFKKVIDNKAAEWKDNPQMCQYLRPNTLFGTKFESYLNQKTVSVPPKPGIEINKKQREGMIDVVEWNI